MTRAAHAEDVLESAILTVTLPARAATLPVLRALGAARATPKADRDGLFKLVVERVDWTWDEERIDAFDEEGEAVSFETKTQYCFDISDMESLARSARACDQTLRALGIPFDMQWNNPLEENAVEFKRARLNRDEPGAYARSFEEPDQPSSDELIQWIKDAPSLEALREWVEQTQEGPGELKDDVELFERELDQPGRQAFLDASAEFLQWGIKSRSWLTPKTQWDPRATQWIATLDAQGQSPLRRFSRHGLTIGLPFIADIARLALAQDPPQPEFCAQALDAYAKPLDGARHVGVSADTALLFADCMDAHPEILPRLAQATREFLSFDLNPRDLDKLGPEGRSMLEARWLRIQSSLARPAAPSAQNASRL